MKKVCIITNIPAPYRIDLFNCLIDSYNEYNFRIIYSAMSEDDRGWEVKNETIRNSIFLKKKSVKIHGKLDKKYIHIPIDIISVLNNENPDIIVASEYNPTCLISFIWAKLKCKKYISWSDGTLNSERDISLLQRKLRKLICKNANSFIASSSKTKEAQLRYGADVEKIFISYLTVDINKYLYVRNRVTTNKLLFVGRLTETKGIDLLLNALAKIKSDYLLTIVGEGDEKKNLIDLSKSLGIQSRVVFIGSKSGEELNQVYRENDIFILPSRCDCFGLVITEAMCNSMPIISSKYADGAYDLVNSSNGFIINPYDGDMIREKLIMMLGNADLVEFMGKQSYKNIQKFKIENSAIEFIKAIKYSIN